MEALLREFQDSDDLEIVVLSTWARGKRLYHREGNVTYHLLSCGHASSFNYRSRSNLGQIRSILAEEKPDLVHFWGTEYPFGFAVSECMGNLPSVIFIQGLLCEIARYYQAGMTSRELRTAYSLRDVLKLDWIGQQQRRYFRASMRERAMIANSGHVISENSWVDAHCRAIDPDVVSHQCELSIRPEFSGFRWLGATTNPRYIMCNASGYPIKGLHMLLKAMPSVLSRYPETTLLVPGHSLMPGSGLSQWARTTGYARYIRHLIRKTGLLGNVRFLGTLTPNDMAEWMSRSSAFVVPSAVENQSSSLKEAMTVGVPCIASYVGGIPDYVVHGNNGLLHRFEDHEMLSEHLRAVLGDSALAESLSAGALRTMAAERASGRTADKMRAIYSAVCDRSG